MALTLNDVKRVAHLARIAISDAEAQSAIDGLNGQSVDGRKIVVNISRPKEAGAGGGGYRSNGPRY